MTEDAKRVLESAAPWVFRMVDARTDAARRAVGEDACCDLRRHPEEHLRSARLYLRLALSANPLEPMAMHLMGLVLDALGEAPTIEDTGFAQSDLNDEPPVS